MHQAYSTLQSHPSYHADFAGISFHYVVKCLSSQRWCSPTISPRSLISGVPLDFKKHCQLVFGSYAQTHEEPDLTNSLNTRTVGAICLGPTGNLQGSYKFFSLHSGKLITCCAWTALPMPQEVMSQCHWHESRPTKASHFL